MKSRERVKRAIEFDRPDRIPYFAIMPWNSDLFPLFPITPRNWQPKKPYMPYVQPLEIKTGAWLSKRRLPRGWLRRKHIAIDEWGVIWERNGAITTLGQVIDEKAPLKNWSALDEFKIPDPRNPQRFGLLGNLSKILGRNKYKVGSIGNFFFERYHFLRGWQNTMVDMVKPNSNVENLLDLLLEYYLAITDEWIKRGADGIICTDDLGGQAEPLMSPRSYKRLFIPRVKKIIEYCHDHGVHFMMHSCGDVRELMALLVDAGLDVFQFDGPDQTGVEWCGEHFGGKVAFMNVVDIQNVIPADKGTPKDIENYVKRMIYYLGRQDGGLIGQEYATPGVLKPQKNAYRIMRKAYKKFGKYPLDIENLK